LVFAARASLFVVGGVLMGWVTAYEVLIGIASPAKTDPQWVAWPLSVTGWAAIPAFVGGTAGYLITTQITAHQARDLDAVIAELRALTTHPPTGSGDGTT
jgi:CBS-domain-containing membrane protein